MYKLNMHGRERLGICMQQDLVLATGRIPGDRPFKPSFQKGNRLYHLVIDETLLGRASSRVNMQRLDSDDYPVVLQLHVPSQPTTQHAAFGAGGQPVHSIVWDGMRVERYVEASKSRDDAFPQCSG